MKKKRKKRKRKKNLFDRFRNFCFRSRESAVDALKVAKWSNPPAKFAELSNEWLIHDACERLIVHRDADKNHDGLDVPLRELERRVQRVDEDCQVLLSERSERFGNILWRNLPCPAPFRRRGGRGLRERGLVKRLELRKVFLGDDVQLPPLRGDCGDDVPLRDQVCLRKRRSAG